jgi:hypothetical protein
VGRARSQSLYRLRYLGSGTGNISEKNILHLRRRDIVSDVSNYVIITKLIFSIHFPYWCSGHVRNVAYTWHGAALVCRLRYTLEEYSNQWQKHGAKFCYFLPWLILPPWRWRRYVPPKRKITYYVYIGPADSVEPAHNGDHNSPWIKVWFMGYLLLLGASQRSNRATQLCAAGCVKLLYWVGRAFGKARRLLLRGREMKLDGRIGKRERGAGWRGLCLC